MSSVSIPTGYGLDCFDSIPDRSKIFLFSIASRPALGPTQPHIQWALGDLSLGVKRQRREADHSPPLVPRSRMVELYLHSIVCLLGMVLN
jgi:hypothetical protein